MAEPHRGCPRKSNDACQHTQWERCDRDKILRRRFARLDESGPLVLRVGQRTGSIPWTKKRTKTMNSPLRLLQRNIAVSSRIAPFHDYEKQEWERRKIRVIIVATERVDKFTLASLFDRKIRTCHITAIPHIVQYLFFSFAITILPLCVFTQGKHIFVNLSLDVNFVERNVNSHSTICVWVFLVVPLCVSKLLHRNAQLFVNFLSIRLL